MLTLTVVTHTSKEMGRDISKCVESIEKALVPGCTHKIINLNLGKDIFTHARYEAFQLDDIVVFADDDYISENSLQLCLDAMNGTSAGIVFTNQIKVQINGSEVKNKIDLSYNTPCKDPESIHHMTAYRSSAVSIRSLELSLKHKCSIEWTTKVDAAFSAGAIYVPVVGYYWVQHAHQTQSEITAHRLGMPLVKEEFEKWVRPTGIIPTWDILS